MFKNTYFLLSIFCRRFCLLFAIYQRLRCVCPAELLTAARLHPVQDDGPEADVGGDPHQPGGRHHHQEGPHGLLHRGEARDIVDKPSEKTESLGRACAEKKLWQSQNAAPKW